MNIILTTDDYENSLDQTVVAIAAAWAAEVNTKARAEATLATTQAGVARPTTLAIV